MAAICRRLRLFPACVWGAVIWRTGADIFMYRGAGMQGSRVEKSAAEAFCYDGCPATGRACRQAKSLGCWPVGAKGIGRRWIG